MAKDKLSRLNVNRGEMATALDRAFERFAGATELEIDERIAKNTWLERKHTEDEIDTRVRAAIDQFKEEQRPKRRWFAPWRKR